MRGAVTSSRLIISAALLFGPVGASTASAADAETRGQQSRSQKAPNEQSQRLGDFKGILPEDVREVAAWAVTSRDARNLPFVIVDKLNARVFVFDRAGDQLGDAPVLLGLAKGDDSVPGIGNRKLATIIPSERTTPAGRFEAALGHDFQQDVLWIDYGAALSLHRVIVGRSAERRHQRLASKSTQDNRISYGCINVPAAFYDRIIVPLFSRTVGIVYILPETKPLRDVFQLPE